MQRFDAPAGHLVHEHVEGRLVELDDVDAVGLQRARFLVQQIGEGERHLYFVAVMRVGDGVGNRHRAGQGDLQLALGMGAGMARFSSGARGL